MSVPRLGQKKSPRAVQAHVVKGRAGRGERRFQTTFTIGRGADCDLQLLDGPVSERHVQVIFDGLLWWLRDLNSAAGTYVDGNRIQVVPLSDNAQLELGKGGPVLALVKESRPPAEAAETKPDEAPAQAADFSSEAEIIQRYLRPSGDRPAGKQTLMFRRAFEIVQKKSSKRYRAVIALGVVVLVAAAGVIAYAAHVISVQNRKLGELRATAEKIFYNAKALELQNSKLERLVLLHGSEEQATQLRGGRATLKQMETQYDSFVQEIGGYSKIPQDEKIILAVARVFGECEVNVPGEFVAEVRRFIKQWKSSDRFSRAMQKAREKGYSGAIVREFTTRNLPIQYMYLPLVESNYDEHAIGPNTRFGYAKGMWQFIAATAEEYQLKVGPLRTQASYDPQDERFDWERATGAAARYIRFLTDNDAQGSGLLVMACYNWGEHNVRSMIDKLPENPQERNFWKLLLNKTVPQETYDYVLSIFSAAVICENPRLFGFDVECPVPAATRAARAVR